MESGILTLRDTETKVSGECGWTNNNNDDACRSAESDKVESLLRRREGGLGGASSEEAMVGTLLTKNFVGVRNYKIRAGRVAL
jgi:hypothetical protein